MSDPNADVKSRQTKVLIGSVSVIFLLVIGGMYFFDMKPAKLAEKPKTVSVTVPGTIDDKDAWRAQEAAKHKMAADQISELKAALARQEERHKKAEEEREKSKHSAEIPTLNSPLPSPAPPSSSGQILSSPYPNMGMAAGTPTSAGSLNAPLNQAAGEMPTQEMEIIRFSNPSKPEMPATPNSKAGNKFSNKTTNNIDFIPAGSFVRTVLLNGIDAPTGGQAQSNPLPVALHVLDIANLANKYKLNIKDCRFIGAAWGDLSSERGMARTESLTCIINGETVEMPIKGMIIGEDGKAGLRGRLVTKQGQILANALLAGIASGIGDAFKQSASTQSISPLGVTSTLKPGDIGRAAIGAGVGNAGNALEQYYLKAADKLFPVIEIDGGRTVEVLITKGAVYTGKTADFRENYRGMVKRSGATSRNYDED